MRNDIMTKSPFTRVLLAGALASVALGSQAACTQADATGTWMVSGLSTVTYDAVKHAEASFTTFCKLKVNSVGVFTNKTSTCQSSIGASGVAGKLTVGATCQVKAFDMKVFAPNGLALYTFTVDYLSIDRSKNSFHATGNKGSAVTALAQFIWVGNKL